MWALRNHCSPETLQSRTRAWWETVEPFCAAVASPILIRRHQWTLARTVTTPDRIERVYFWPLPSHGWHFFFPHFLFLKPHLAPVTSSLTFKWAWSAWTFVLEVLGDGQTLRSGFRVSLPLCLVKFIPKYQIMVFWFFFLIHKPHQFTQIIWEMFGKATQFLSKAITHITSKQNKKYICGRFVSYQKDRGSFFPSLHNESYIISSLSVGQYEELLPSFLWGRGGPIVGSIFRVEVCQR